PPPPSPPFPYTTLFRSPRLRRPRHHESLAVGKNIVGAVRNTPVPPVDEQRIALRHRRRRLLGDRRHHHPRRTAIEQRRAIAVLRSEEHTSELQSRFDLV